VTAYPSHETDPPVTVPPAPTPPPKQRSVRAAVEWIAIIVGALLVALIIKALLIQAFYIPSESMVPTLKIGDRVLVNKVSYRMHDIHRGDIVVFERPNGETDPRIKDLIKRVVGLPGDVIEARDGKVLINDHVLDEPYLPTGTTTTNLPRQLVPPHHVFVMGDNRTNSRDSRVFQAIDEDLVVGRAFVRVWPIGDLGLLCRCDHVDVPVVVVAEDPVDPHPDEAVDDALELRVPSERVAPEAVEQGDEPARPVRVVEVDAVDAGAVQLCRPTLGSLLHALEPCRVDEADVVAQRRAPTGDDLPVRMAQPQRGQVVAGRLGNVDHGAGGGVVLHVERQVVLGAALGVEVLERRDVRRELGPRQLGDRPPPHATSHDAVVVEHGHAVRGQPHVALEPGRPEPQCQLERLDRVLRRVRPRPAMPEGDRR
jgi:signal peptidase I